MTTRGSAAYGEKAQYVSVKDYGAKGDGITDDTSSIQAAINDAEAGAYSVYFPAGIYKHTGLTIDGSYVSLVGDGKYASILSCSSATGSVEFTGSSLPLCSVRNLGFRQTADSSSATSSLLKLTDVFRFLAHDCFFNGYSGASNYAHNLIYANGTSVVISACDGVGGKTAGVYLTGGNDYFLYGCTFNQSTTTGKPLHVKDVTAGAVAITDCAFLEGLECKFDNSKYITVKGTYFDSAQSAVNVSGCEHIYFTAGCEFANRPGGGVAFTTSKYFTIANSMVINCGLTGINVDSSSSDFSFIGNVVDGNNTTNTAGNHGINIAANISGFVISGNRIGNLTSGFSGHQKRGIAVQAGTSDNYVISSNDLRSNESSAMADNGTGTSARVIDNLGYNPVTAVAAAAGASPYTYTAGHAPEAVYIYGGTVSSIVTASNTIFTSTDRTVFLGPNQSVVITHSAAPTVLRVPL